MKPVQNCFVFVHFTCFSSLLKINFVHCRGASTENAGKSHRQEFEGSALRHTQQPDNKSAVQRSAGQQKFGQGLKLVNQSQSLKQAGALKKEVPVNKEQQMHSTVDDQVFV